MNVTIGFRIFSNKTCSLWQINRYYFNAFSSRQLTAWADFATFLPSFSHSQNSDLQTSWQQLYCRNSHMCLVTTAVLSHFSHMSRDNSWTVTLLTRVSWQQLNCRTSHMCLVTTAELSHFSHVSRDNRWTVALLTHTHVSYRSVEHSIYVLNTW